MRSLYHRTWQTCIWDLQLRKYIASLTPVLEEEDVQVRKDLIVGVGSVRILDS